MTTQQQRSTSAARIGALFWIAAAVLFLSGNAVAQLAWDTPFSLRHNNISDLGHVTCAYTDPVDNPPVRYICSPLHTLFNASLVASGILIIIGVLLTSPVWGRGVLPTTARALIGLGAFGYVLAGAGAADANLGVHLLGALLALAVANVGLIVAAPALGRGSPASLRAPTLIIGLVALAAAILHFNRVYLGLGMGGMERVAAFALLLWLTIVAVTVLSGRRPRSR